MRKAGWCPDGRSLVPLFRAAVDMGLPFVGILAMPLARLGEALDVALLVLRVC